MDLSKRYKDSGDNPRTILEMVEREPYWAANRIQAGEKAEERVSALETTIRTFLHDLDAHEARVNPSEIRMNSAMWMQVQAFRNLLEKKQ